MLASVRPVAKGNGRIKDVLVFLLLNVLPIVLGAAASAAGVLTQVWTNQATVLRLVAVGAGVLAALLLVAKAAFEFNWGRTKRSVRYSSLLELHNRLSSLLAIIDEMAREDQTQLRANRVTWSKQMAAQGANALVSMVPESRDARAAVYQLGTEGGKATLSPAGVFGRRDTPRTFTEGTEEGDEVFAFLESATRPARYPDTRKRAPQHYTGDVSRYRTFIRAPIYSEGAVYGMLTVDAPKKKSLSKGDEDVAGLVAAVLAIGFSVAAN